MLSRQEKGKSHGMEISMARVKQICGGEIVNYFLCSLL